MTVILGDCRDVMRGMADGSVSSVICDPPYGLKFMGKGWDHGVPGVEFWAEALRVAAPGSRLLAFGGTRTYHRLTCAIEDAGWRIEDCLSWLYGSGFPKHKSKLKPAWEPIILAHKPTKGAVPLNVDACRIGTDNTMRPVGVSPTARMAYGAFAHDKGDERRSLGSVSGRWPANVVLDEEAAEALDAQSGETPASHRTTRNHQGGEFGWRAGNTPGFADSGGASRFYYTAKASRSEREAGLDGMPLRDYPVSVVQTPGVGLHGESINGKQVSRARNHHPTVKPLALMRWLCRLITPPNGVILDPFCGSGTTGCAAVLEGFDFIGIDLDPEYVAIAERRIAHHGQQSVLPLAEAI